jgi:hypothetical protein
MTAIDLHRSHTPSVFSAKGAVSKQPGASPQDCGWVINERCRREDKGRSHGHAQGIARLTICKSVSASRRSGCPAIVGLSCRAKVETSLAIALCKKIRDSSTTLGMTKIFRWALGSSVAVISITTCERRDDLLSLQRKCPGMSHKLFRLRARFPPPSLDHRLIRQLLPTKKPARLMVWAVTV